MNVNFVKADSSNLPTVDFFMLHNFYISNTDFLSSEMRQQKNIRATMAKYGDDAVGYVQLRRINNLCTVKARVTPEHKVRGNPYNVSAVIDEEKDEIFSCECECPASAGGCKHSIAFLFWLFRRSEEPSVTSTECYWRKATLAKVGTDIKFIKCSDFKQVKMEELSEEKMRGFREELVESISADSHAQLIKHIKWTDNAITRCSMHQLAWRYIESNGDITNMSNFLSFCGSSISEKDCKLVEVQTRQQSKTHDWYEIRYGRITASKIYEASRCTTKEASLHENLLGATAIVETLAMKRGRNLEEEVLKEVGHRRNIKITKPGIFINNIHPVFGASPDGLSQHFCIEIKCPYKESTISNYYENGTLSNKAMAQIQLQMLFTKKTRGLFLYCIP